MYIAQAYKGLHEWWRYVVGLIIAIMGVFIFSIPHGIGIMFKTMQGGTIDPSKMGDTAYLMGLFDSNVNLVFILLPFVGGFLFLLGAVKWLHKQSITSLTTARPKIDWKRFWVIFFFWGIPLARVPQVVCYQTSPLTYLLARWVLKIRFISLVNIIMDREVVKELIQGSLNQRSLVKEIGLLLPGGWKRGVMESDYGKLSDMLSGRGAAAAVARDIVNSLKMTADVN